MNNLRYIGPFFRMNKLSQKEIKGQLFHFSKEAVRTLVLESKCGLVDSLKNYTKTSSSIDINTIGNISPLLCMYRKSSPNYIHSKSLNGFDEDSFKRDIVPITNALMTINILNLSTYYSKFRDIDEKLYSYSIIYNQLAKEQLNFYSSNLRSAEGVFVQKRNTSENNSRNFNLTNRNNKFKFSDQAFMMVAYNLYSTLFPEEETSMEYTSFSSEILEVLIEYKEKIYDLPFDEIVKILLAVNLYFYNSGDSNAENLIIDLTDYLITKFDEKDYYVDQLDDVALFALVLMYSYQNTLIISFKEKAKEIIDKLTSLYDEEKELYLKLSSRKEIRYSAFDLTFYFLALSNYANLFDEVKDYRDILSSLYRKCFINSGIINCWPESPTLDEPERYRNLSLKSEDMLDEIFFRMPTMPTPATLGIAPIFNKYVTYSKKRESFSSSTSSFNSYRNMLIHTLIIELFEEPTMKELNILDDFQEDNTSFPQETSYFSEDEFQIPKNFEDERDLNSPPISKNFQDEIDFNNIPISKSFKNERDFDNLKFFINFKDQKIFNSSSPTIKEDLNIYDTIDDDLELVTNDELNLEVIPEINFADEDFIENLSNKPTLINDKSDLESEDNLDVVEDFEALDVIEDIENLNDLNYIDEIDEIDDLENME